MRPYFLTIVLIFASIFEGDNNVINRVYPAGNNELEKGKDAKNLLVPAGKINCFHQTLFLNEVVNLEYKVLEATQGERYVSLEITDPIGRVIIKDSKKSDNSHRFNATLNGNFKICFDNTFDALSHKILKWIFVTAQDNVKRKN